MKTLIFYVCILLFSLPLPLPIPVLYAQDISLLATVDKKIISLDDQIVLQISVSGEVSSLPTPELPPLPNFTAYSAGRSQNVSFVNGQVSSSIVFNYLLTPKTIGKFTIPAITLNYKGKTYSTSPIPVEVIKSGTNLPPPGALPAPGTPPVVVPPGPSAPQSEGRDIFITVSVDKKIAYVGEQITLNFYFYRRVQLLSNPEYDPPQVSGFWREDLPPQKTYRTVVGGREYLVTEIRTALFPTTDGKFTIGSATLRCQVQDFSGDDFFNNLFSMSRGKTKLLRSEPIEVRVLPLPEEGKPEDFGGAVGKYRITAEVDKREIKLHQPVTLSIKIAGIGNIKSVSELQLEHLNNFKKYDTVSSLNISKQNYLVQGEKVFRTVIVPQVAGNQFIPAQTFSFFDPGQKKYIQLKTGTIPVNILAGEAEPAVSSGFTPEGIKLVGRDIRFNKVIKELDDQERYLYKSGLFWLIQLMPFFFFGIAVTVKWRQQNLKSNPVRVRSGKALALFGKRAKTVKKLINLEKKKEFSAGLADAFVNYLADRLNLSPPGITQEQIKQILFEKGVEKNLIEETGKLLEEYDFSRFAPTNIGLTQMEELYSRSEKIVLELEKKI